MKKILYYKGIVVPLVIVFAFGFFAFTGCSEDGDDDNGKNLQVTILQTTDMHNRVTGYGQHTLYSPDGLDNDSVLGGFARLATKTNEIRDAQTADDIPVLLLDSGDYTMGTVYDLLWDTDPAPFAYLQHMQYDAVTLGNHEFDYNPQRLADMITTAQGEGFDIPIVASNMVFDDTDTEDDDLEALQTSGDIVTTFIKTLDNGLIVGIVGLLGETADDYAPNAVPVTFNSDYSDTDVQAAIQATVNTLRSQSHVVVALSHSGLTDVTPSAPAGDDVTLAENISGIDIILSGHEHKRTDSVVSVTNTTTGHVTRIVCAGAYTRNLLQVDFTVNTKSRSIVSDVTLTNHTIDDTIVGDTDVNDMVDTWDTAINAMSLDYDIEDTVATTTPALSSSSPGENGLGSLIADSFRYVGTSGTEQTFGGCANGTIRNSFTATQAISFADLFALLPLGMTSETDQDPLLPGYPLLKIYVYGDEVWDICGFNAKIIQYYAYLPSYSEYFVSLSGLQYTYDTSYAVTDVNAYAYDDYDCTGTASTDILDDESTLYPMIIDSYVMAMLLSDSIQTLLGNMGFSIVPKLSDETVITEDNMGLARLDSDGVTIGTQEYQCWQAFADYLSVELGGTIPNDPYGSDLGRINP